MPSLLTRRRRKRSHLGLPTEGVYNSLHHVHKPAHVRSVISRERRFLTFAHTLPPTPRPSFHFCATFFPQPAQKRERPRHGQRVGCLLSLLYSGAKLQTALISFSFSFPVRSITHLRSIRQHCLRSPSLPPPPPVGISRPIYSMEGLPPSASTPHRSIDPTPSQSRSVGPYPPNGQRTTVRESSAKKRRKEDVKSTFLKYSDKGSPLSSRYN